MTIRKTVKEFFSENGWPIVALAAFSSVIFGVKLWLIGSYGNATPFWDQWEAEAANLYKPFLDGTLVWSDLFSFHNEHRIFTTRLLALILLNVNGVWSPLLQMVVNAGLHIAVLLLCLVLLTRVIGRNGLPALLAFSLVLFGVPYAWENTLGGMQEQFYFVFLFSIASLWLTILPTPFSARWWGGVICAVFAVFSFASGISPLMVTAIIGFTFYGLGVRKTTKQLLAVAFLGGLFILGAWQTPSLAKHVSHKAASLHQFFHALTEILSWPVSPSFFSALFQYSPALVFVGWMLWKKPPANDRRWFLLALVFWGFVSAVSLAYGRATGCVASRYLDGFAIAALANFACLISLGKDQPSPRRAWVISGMLVWIIAFLMSLGLTVGRDIPAELTAKRDTSRRQELNMRSYLATGDFVHLKGKPFLDVPYSSAERLASICASSDMRAILPANIKPPMIHTSVVSHPTGVFVVDGVAPTTPKRTGMVWGSYGVQGNTSTGDVKIGFEANKDSMMLAIPVAGDSRSNGINIEVEQKGRRSPLVIKKNPKGPWKTVYVKVCKGPFFIHVTDLSSMAWVAVGAPSVTGIWDPLTLSLLARWPFFIMLGLAAGVLLITLKCLTGYAAAEPEDRGII